MTDPRPLFAEFNRGVARARRAYTSEQPVTPAITCRIEGCQRDRDGHHSLCWACRRGKS